MTYRQPFKGDYPITQMFGEKITDPKGHTGIDYACPLGTRILASSGGQVIFASWDPTGYGNCVMIRHRDGNATVYAHLGSFSAGLGPGQYVIQGEVIGFSGNTGNSTGPHLHFEARDPNGKPFDPMVLPLINYSDAVAPKEPAEDPAKPKPALKDASEFARGEVLRITAPLGAKGFRSSYFSSYEVLPSGTELLYTGETAQHNGYIYMRCYPLTSPLWVAVHDNDCQIIDREQR